LKKRFASIDGPVAVDMDERFTGWRSEIVQFQLPWMRSFPKRPRVLTC
jgi:hypothetical protein